MSVVTVLVQLKLLGKKLLACDSLFKAALYKTEKLRNNNEIVQQTNIHTKVNIYIITSVYKFPLLIILFIQV